MKTPIDYAKLSTWDRLKHMKTWLLFLVIAAALTAYGIYRSVNFYQNLDPLSKEIAQVTVDLSVLKVRLKQVQRELMEKRNNGHIPEGLIKEEENVRMEIIQTEEILDELMRKCEKVGCMMKGGYQRAAHNLPEPFFTKTYSVDRTIIDGINTQETAYRRFTLMAVIAVMGIVYFLVLFKVFSSSNPRNMNAAIDAFKTITGFWIGLGTALAGIT